MTYLKQLISTFHLSIPGIVICVICPAVTFLVAALTFHVVHATFNSKNISKHVYLTNFSFKSSFFSFHVIWSISHHYYCCFHYHHYYFLSLKFLLLSLPLLLHIYISFWKFLCTINNKVSQEQSKI